MMKELVLLASGKTTAKMLEEANDRLALAESSLKAAGFTQASPSNQWKPPVGPSASPMLQRIDDLSTQRDELLSLVEEFAGAMQDCGDWPDTTSSMASLARIAEKSRNYISKTKRLCCMSNHAPEPWKCEGYVVYFPDLIGGFSLQHCPDAEATARRIVACINASAGMADPAAEIAELKRQRDELLVAMRQTLAMLRVTSHGPSAANKAEEMLHAAICSLGADHSPNAAKMVPDGWQLVPVKPTEEMITASVMKRMGASSMEELDCNAGIWAARDCLAYYLSMLASAPKPEGVAA